MIKNNTIDGVIKNNTIVVGYKKVDGLAKSQINYDFLYWSSSDLFPYTK